MSLSPISMPFRQKKTKILTDLAMPPIDYTDASPKGSIDDGIRDLISFVNGLDGYVTTSSCAGRISVYAEGLKTIQSAQGRNSEQPLRSRRAKSEVATVGGKGGSGKFLFVSHETVDWEQFKCGSLLSLVHFMSFNPRGSIAVEPKNVRFVRFAFEPMILHVMCASLRHARPLLRAAVNAGFRESGVQSLKNLDDPEACPMVAIRTAGGLSMQSIIGLVESDENGNDRYHAFTGDDQLKVLFEAANARFEANARMAGNFRDCLKAALEVEGEKIKRENEWEDSATRKARKRQEGIAKSQLLRSNAGDTATNTA